MQTIHITANSRLSAIIKQQAVIGAVKNVVQTPKVMTLSQWWQEWQSTALLTGQIDPKTMPNKILNSFEAQWLWEQLLQEELDKHSDTDNELGQIALLNIHTTAKQLYQAWVLMAEWLPEEWHKDEILSNESKLFKQVLQRYLTHLKVKNWQDDALFSLTQLSWLSEDGVGKNHLPEQFCLHGFDDLSPNIQRWQQTVETMGCCVKLIENQQSNEVPVEAQLSYYPAQDIYDEVEQMAFWAIKKVAELSQNKPFEQIKVALVAPNVVDYKVALTQCLDEQLYLNALGHLHSQPSASHAKLYNLSLGQTLFSVPLIENAWQTLSLFFQPEKSTTYQTWSQWLISPYTQGDFVQRQQADAQFRRLQWANVQWPKLLETQAATNLPNALKEAMNDCLALSEKNKTSQKTQSLSLSDFMEQAWLLLETIVWPGNRTLNSDEYQQKTAFENSMTQFSKLADIGGKQSVSKWLNLLKRYLSEQVHQSQSVGHQPIQIMGMLEAGGQEFDALWIMGLTNEAWPRMPNPNPFLPMHLQRKYGLPRSDANRELIYAQQISQRLLQSASEVIWSYPQQTGEATLLPSTILPIVKPFEVNTYQSLSQTLYSLRDKENGLQWELDIQGTEIAEGSMAPGGTGILQAQSQCPLMAYIDYRLGAKYGFQQVEDSLQNTNQGTLIHAVLEHFWQETQTQVAMLTLTEEERVQRLTHHIEQAFDELQGGLAAGILKVEQARILELCMQWLDLEGQRENFAVVETEVEHLITLAGIQFKVFIDRVDEVNGQAVILDYKTGKASINRLLETPLAAPQLAVYLKGVTKEVAGIGYALLHSDDGVK
ncbi:MAG TPA: hypothetical protein ENK73_05320, partial [Thiomicrospira sp.]|nr:hypothetical protein [Thiomicrospira sp.]